MTHETISRPSSGSRWQRWEPHVHAPGTLLNDQFGGSWTEYLTKLESAEPPIRALGVTDYYLLDGYRAVRDAREQGQLQGCELIFANVEMRLAVGTVKGSWVNCICW